MPAAGRSPSEGRPTRPRGGVPALALLASLLVLAAAAGGTLTSRHAATVTPATTVPATMASTHATIPAPATAATITGVALPLGGLVATTVLTLQHGPDPWSVVLVATAKSGFSPVPDSVVLTLVGPTSPSITLTSASAVPATTAAVSMGTTSDLTVTARGICIGTCSITLELRLTPAAAAVPVVVLPVALSVT